MHSASFDIEPSSRDGGDVLVAIATLVTEGRIPGGKASANKGRGFYEGPHCAIAKCPSASSSSGSQQQQQQQGAQQQQPSSLHNCSPTDELCRKYEKVRSEVLHLWKKGIPLCVEVLFTALCPCKDEDVATDSKCESDDLLMEQWFFSVSQNRISDPQTPFNINQLISAVRSQLYFSQISAWLSSQEQGFPKITNKNLKYRLTIPGETFEQNKFTKAAAKHDFPSTDLGNGYSLKVSLLSLPRMLGPPNVCRRAKKEERPGENWAVLDDRMHVKCTLKGKHRCEDFDELEMKKECKYMKHKRVCCGKKFTCEASTSGSEKRNGGSSAAEQAQKTPKLDLKFSHEDLQGAMGREPPGRQQHRGDVLLNAILRSCRLQNEAETTPPAKCDVKCVQKLGSSLLGGCAKALQSVSDNTISDNKNAKSDIFNNVTGSRFSACDSRGTLQPPPPPRPRYKMRDISNVCKAVPKRITFDEFKAPACVERKAEDEQVEKSSINIEIPSPVEQAKFRKSLDSAASMVFHARTGLPLTSSPAPVRRGKSCFDFDSSINSVSAIKSALFSASFSTDDDSESDGSIVSPCSPDTYVYPKKQPSPVKHYRRGHSANLLGSFEESVLNGRLEPVSTVHGFKAELGASGSFVPRHLGVPVTVFFYTLGDNDKVSSPYLAHINLGKKGYNVPKSGTVQVTLFNPLGTVVKMFVIMYDLTDMPPNSQTFIRQRTLYMPTNCQDKNLEWGPKWLRYLIHLRFMSSKSGRIYLHSDIRMIIFRKCDMDTATAHGIDMCYELRSFTHMPANPKYSPKK